MRLLLLLVLAVGCAWTNQATVEDAKAQEERRLAFERATREVEAQAREREEAQRKRQQLIAQCQAMVADPAQAPEVKAACINYLGSVQAADDARLERQQFEREMAAQRSFEAQRAAVQADRARAAEAIRAAGESFGRALQTPPPPPPPRQTVPQTTNCVPNGLGGMRCSSY